MAQLAIKGHSTKGKEVIEILKMLGGKNVTNYDGSKTKSFYFLNNTIICSSYGSGKLLGIDCYTLEEFLEKFPYKVGDKAFAFGNKCTIVDAVWDEGIDEVVYTIKLDTSKYTTTKLSNQLRPCKEETMKEIKIDIPKGYEFAGVDDDNKQVVFTKIQPQYPKTYDECCEIMGIEYPVVGGKPDGLSASTYRITEIRPFIYLLICRDAYWKIAGEQMGLGKSWEPDWTNDEWPDMAYISYDGKSINKEYGFPCCNIILIFPTKEMRDAFYENFKDLIEQCKELL